MADTLVSAFFFYLATSPPPRADATRWAPPTTSTNL